MTLANPSGPARSAGLGGADHRAVGMLRRPLQRPELASLGGLVAAFTVFSIIRPDLFLSRDNGINVGSLAAQYGIVAVGVTVLMIAGQFDLSVGTIVGLSGWAMYYFGNVLGLPPIVTILCALGFGTLLGAINGIIQVRTGLPSFIITLATSLVYRGILTRNTSGFPVVVKFPGFLCAGDRRQAPVRLPHVAAVVPRDRGAGHRCSCCAPGWATGPSRLGKTPPRPRISACRSPVPR